MSDQKSRTFEPKPEGQEMTMVDTVQGWADRLESIEIARTGLPRKTIRPIVARKAGVALGTLENIRRGRVKDPRASVVERIRSALLREIESEIRAHEHEKQTLIQTGADPRSPSLQEVDAGLAALRKAIGTK